MFLLRMSDVDGSGYPIGKWVKRPTNAQIGAVLVDYHSPEKAKVIAKELLFNGECDVRDASCTVYEIEEI